MCTSVVVGKNASITGSTMIARNCDSEKPVQPVKFITVLENENNHKETVYHSYVTKFSERYPEKSLRYHMMPFVDDKNLGIFGEAGINSENVAMSATESIFGNANVLALDPLTDAGIGEDSLLNMVLPYIHSAREGVEYLGKIIAKHGSHEGNGIIFSDKDEIWYMEIPCGHHWVAQRIPDDCCAVMANQCAIQNIDFDDVDNYMYSEGLREFVEKNKLNPDHKGFNFRHIFGTSNKQDRRYNTSRVWYGQNYLGFESDDPQSSEMTFVFKPNRKIMVDDVAAVLSSHYDETVYDPFGDMHPETEKMYRPISMNRTAESHILEIRNHVPKESAALIWINSAPTAFNPYVPFYANSYDTAPSYNDTSMEFDLRDAYWVARLMDVLVERDYKKLNNTSFGYLKNARTLAKQLIYETDQMLEENTEKDITEVLTQANYKNIERMNALAMQTVGTLVKQGLGLSKLTFDITKDV